MTKQHTTEQTKHFATLAKNHTAFLKRFQKAHPDFDFETLHFHDEARIKKLNTLRIPHDSFKTKLGIAKRLSRLHHDPAVQSKLLKSGFHSAQQVTQLSERTFVNTYAKPLGLSANATTQVYNNAVATQEKVRLMLANVKTTVGSPHYQALKLTNVGDDVTTYFEQLPSYQEMFGNQDYCSCAECKSIFGPAAYFVDLMRIIDKYITTPNSTTIPTQPTNLTFFNISSGTTYVGRRSDLPLIPLTCENTNTLIPYITIVIERLFALVSTELNLSSNLSQAYQTLATTTTYPFQLPYNLPLTQVRNYLSQLNLSLAGVYASGKVAPTAVASENFGFSFDQTGILTTAATGTTLNGYYGFPSTTNLVTTLTPIVTFMFQTKLLVDAFQVLLFQDLSPTEISNNVAHNFFINQGFSSNGYLQITTDNSGTTTFTNLSTDTCDRLNRFIRFSQNANVDFITLDWLLRVGSGTSTSAISSASIQQASAILALAQQWKADVITTASLFGPMKTYGSGLDGTAQSLFDRIYNNPSILQGATPYHPTGNPLNSGYTSNVTSWTPGATDATNVSTLSWLASSLNLSQDDTILLGTTLFTATATPLTVENLSALYRHAFLAAQLNLTITQYMVFLPLTALSKTLPFTPDQVAQVLLTAQQFKTNRLTVYDASYFISGTPNLYALPVYDPTTVNTWLQLLWSNNPEGTATAQPNVVVNEAIANYFSSSSEIITAISTIFIKAIALPNGVSNWYDAFLTLPATGSTTSPYSAYINSVLALTSQWVYLIKKLNLPASLITSVGTYPASYGFTTNFASYTPQNILSLITFNNYFTTFGDVNQQLLLYVAAFNADPSTATTLLCGVTGWNVTQTNLLIPIVANGETNLVVQIADLAASWNVLNTLKADVVFYQSLLALNALQASSGWTTYENTAQQTLQKVQAVFSPSQWAGVMDQINSRIALSTRDALLAIALWQLNIQYKDIQTSENVYEYLLIDVNMGDTTMISYIREGLNACQLYLQRCRLRIEQGVDVLDIPDSWWEWMMQYRVWEANRQIFVYPENYLVPSIRHTKTALFVDLENQLQQSDITDAFIESSYKTYLNSFSELSKLVPIQSMQAIVKDSEKGDISTKFVVARTTTQPYTYYYCSQQDGYPWSDWSEITITIDAPYVTPVFAFNRLYIFWAELKATVNTSISSSSGNVQSNQSTVYSAEIRCTFLDLENNWVNPQVVKTEPVVFYSLDGNGLISLFNGLFDMSTTPWLKVFASRITNTNLQSFDQTQTNFERIFLTYGPFLNQGAVITQPSNVPTDSTEHASFKNRLYVASANYFRTAESYGSGNQAYVSSLVLNQDLSSDYIICNNEFYNTDPYTPNTAPLPYMAIVNSLSGQLQVAYNTDVIYENYLGDYQVNAPASGSTINQSSFSNSFISNTVSGQIYNTLKTAGVIDDNGNVVQANLLQLNLVTTLNTLISSGTVTVQMFSYVQKILFLFATPLTLFSSIPTQSSYSEPVLNQPGSFVFSDGIETFFIEPAKKTISGNPSQARFSTLGQGVEVSRPRINQVTFLQCAGVTYTQSNLLYQQLTSYTLLNPDGTVNLPNVSTTILGMILSGIAPPLPSTCTTSTAYNILMGYPIIFSDAFVTNQISSTTSTSIYNAFKSYGLIDVNGRVALNNLTGSITQMVLTNLINQNAITSNQIPEIYSTIYNTPPETDLKYVNANADSSITSLTNYQFNITRLTTDAIQPLSRSLLYGGVSQLISLQSQQIPVVPVLPFSRFTPATQVNYPSAIDGSQVDFDGLYGEYFWELFYHIPCLLADSLNTNQNFREAMAWYEYIFNPHAVEQFITSTTFSDETRGKITPAQSASILTSLQSNNIGSPLAPVVSAGGVVNTQYTAATSLSFLSSQELTTTQLQMVSNILLNYQIATASAHYWQFQPFRMYIWPTLTQMLNDDNPAMAVYNDDPFNPFAIARLRIGAFEKYAVMQYIENLINWGDQQFTEDTWESISAATMLYVYALDLLGQRPVNLGNCPTSSPATFADIQAKYGDDIPQFLIDLENLVPGGNSLQLPLSSQGFNDLDVYFCVPENTQLLSYWDVIEDRLYKIRNSMNINGVVRTLALFEPPLNPMDLAKAAASGSNLPGGGVGGKYAPMPYRFDFLITQARDLTSTLIQLGASLLAALEKNDAEQLNMLHSTQESVILNMNIQVRQNAITQLQQSIQSMQYTLDSAQYRENYYTTLIANGLNSAENTNLDAMAAGLAFNILGSILKTAASIGYAIPQVGSPFAMTYGGIQVGSMVNAAAGAAEVGGEISNFIAQRALTMAGYQRRAEDWTFQQQTAAYDVSRIQEDMAGLQTQLSSAQQDLAILQKQIEQNTAITNFLQSKFTNQQLYAWMVGQLSGVYYQTYQLAYTYAMKAQLAFQMETDMPAANFLTINYWDSLRKGLLAGEYLMLSLQRMNVQYQTVNTRRYEIEKNISLAMTNPQAFLDLKAKGTCNFSFTEELFDYDYPGQYARKITTMSVTIPAVVGPYQNIKATLKQTFSAWVYDPTADAATQYLLDNETGTAPDGLIENWLPNQSIAISKGLDDNGMFVLNFEDPRYLPFEGTGAVSNWTLDMPATTNRFDLNSITDVIFTVKYTALYDASLETKVKGWLAQYPYEGGLYYVLQQAFASQWYAFISNQSSTTSQSLTFPIAPNQLNAYKTVSLTGVLFLVETAEGMTMPVTSQFMNLTIGSQTAKPVSNAGAIGTLAGLSLAPADFMTNWVLEFNLTAMKADPNLSQLLTNGFIDPTKLLGVEMIMQYSATVFNS
jgi:hypothetical protein